MPQEQTNIKDRERTRLKEPRRYKVVMHNDDFTTMDFVVMVLKQVFFHPEEKALSLMLQIHHTGKAVVGVYSYDIAMSKAEKASSMAEENGFPLSVTVEPEDKND